MSTNRNIGVVLFFDRDRHRGRGIFFYFLYVIQKGGGANIDTCVSCRHVRFK